MPSVAPVTTAQSPPHFLTLNGLDKDSPWELNGPIEEKRAHLPRNDPFVDEWQQANTKFNADTSQREIGHTVPARVPANHVAILAGKIKLAYKSLLTWQLKWLSHIPKLFMTSHSSCQRLKNQNGSSNRGGQIPNEVVCCELYILL